MPPMRLSTRKRPDDTSERGGVRPARTPPVADGDADSGPAASPAAGLATVRHELRDLRASVAQARGALVVAESGELIAADLGPVSASRLAAQVVAAMALGPRLAAAAEVGPASELTLCGGDGYVALYAAGERAVLGVLAAPTVNLGRLRLRSRQAADRIEAALAASASTSEATPAGASDLDG